MACFPAILSGGPFSIAKSFASIFLDTLGREGSKGEGGGYGDARPVDGSNHALCGGYGGSDRYGSRCNGDGYGASDRYGSRDKCDGYGASDRYGSKVK